MSIGPPTGMRDWLPHETLLRQRLMETIGSVYRLYRARAAAAYEAATAELFQPAEVKT